MKSMSRHFCSNRLSPLCKGRYRYLPLSPSSPSFVSSSAAAMTQSTSASSHPSSSSSSSSFSSVLLRRYYSSNAIKNSTQKGVSVQEFTDSFLQCLHDNPSSSTPSSSSSSSSSSLSASSLLSSSSLCTAALDRIAVALSGGPDSMALMYLLFRMIEGEPLLQRCEIHAFTGTKKEYPLHFDASYPLSSNMCLLSLFRNDLSLSLSFFLSFSLFPSFLLFLLLFLLRIPLRAMLCHHSSCVTCCFVFPFYCVCSGSSSPFRVQERSERHISRSEAALSGTQCATLHSHPVPLFPPGVRVCVYTCVIRASMRCDHS